MTTAGSYVGLFVNKLTCVHIYPITPDSQNTNKK